MTKTLEALQLKEKKLSAELSRIREVIELAKQAAVKKKYGLGLDSVVKDVDGKEYKVDTITVMMDGKPWITGNPRKKNGKFGTAKRRLYKDWEVVHAKV